MSEKRSPAARARRAAKRRAAIAHQLRAEQVANRANIRAGAGIATWQPERNRCDLPTCRVCDAKEGVPYAVVREITGRRYGPSGWRKGEP